MAQIIALMKVMIMLLCLTPKEASYFKADIQIESEGGEFNEDEN